MAIEVRPAGAIPAQPLPARELLTRRLTLAAVALTVTYLGVLLWQLKSIVEAASWNADNANMLNMSRELGGLGADEVVNMGNAPNTTTLWFNAGLDKLGSGTLLELAPLLWYALAAILLTWATWVAVGRLAAATTAVILACLNPVSLELATSHAVHGPTWVTVAALGVYATVLPRIVSRQGRLPIVLATAVGLLAGANVASDPLAAPTAVVPFLITLAALWFVTFELRRRFLIHGAAFLTSVAIAGVGVRFAGPATGIGADFPPGNFATPDQIWTSFLQSIESAGRFFGPAPFGRALSLFGALQLLVGLIGIAGVVIVVRLGWKAARQLLRPTVLKRGADAAADHLAITVYWAASVVVGAAVVLSSPLASEVRESLLRYEFNLFFAAAVTLPIWLLGRGAWGRPLAAVLAIAVAGVGIGGLLETRSKRTKLLQSAMDADGPRAIEYARSKGATRGYAGYWNASGLSWKTGSRLLPVANCESPQGRTLCLSPFAVPPHLMTPKPKTKSFILVDHTYPGAPEDRYLTLFGPWEEQLAIGGVYLAIYPYDIGTRFGPRLYTAAPGTT